MLRRISATVLCLTLLFLLWGCSNDSTPSQSDSETSGTYSPEPPPEEMPTPETPAEAASSFVTALQSGDWEAASKRLAPYSVTGFSLQQSTTDGVMKKIMQSMVVQADEPKQMEDGTYVVAVTIEAVDYRSLLEALPEGIESKEDARSKMLTLIDSAPHKCFDGQLTLTANPASTGYYVEPDIGFVNGITGGFYDVYSEMMEEVMKQ